MDRCEFVGERTIDDCCTIYCSNFAISRGVGGLFMYLLVVFLKYKQNMYQAN